MLCHWATSPTHKYLLTVSSVNLFFCFFCFETKSHNLVQAGLKLTVLLPLPLRYWDYSHGPPCLVEVYFIVVKFIILLWLITFLHLKTSSFLLQSEKNTLQYSLPKVSWFKSSWFYKSLFGVDWSLYMVWGQIQFLFLFSYMTIQWDQLI
jgi:hypothetical protein